MQKKLEHEQQNRKVMEEKLLDMEKTKSGYALDLQQARAQVQSLQMDLHNEIEKVHHLIFGFVGLKGNM